MIIARSQNFNDWVKQYITYNKVSVNRDSISHSATPTALWESRD